MTQKGEQTAGLTPLPRAFVSRKPREVVLTDKQALIVAIIAQSKDPIRGFDVVDRSGGALHRCSVYNLLGELVNKGVLVMGEIPGTFGSMGFQISPDGDVIFDTK